MIKLFACDIDGCLTTPFETPPWEIISEIRRLNQESEHDPDIPAITICTGRPMSYAEAVAQWLDVRYPIIFESGAGLYDLKKNEMFWSPNLHEPARKALHQVKNFVYASILPHYTGIIPEFTKAADVGVISNKRQDIIDIYERLHSYAQQFEGLLEVHYTDVSVNVIAAECSKGTGLEHLAELTGIGLHEMAYIGDGMNDLPALERAARPFVPSNARAFLKELPNVHVTKGEASAGVLEAYRLLLPR